MFTRKLKHRIIYMANKNPNPPSLGRQLNFTTGQMNALCQTWLAPHGLSLPQWVVLSCLWREGEISIGLLAERVGTGLPATSRIVDRMEDRGLLVKRKDPEDRRSVLIAVTAAGQALDHLARFYDHINEALLAGFTPTERSLAFDLLARMEHNARAAQERDGP